MARQARPWFRFYVEACYDRKLRRLKPSERWLWVAVLAIARQSCRPGWLLVSQGEPFRLSDIADFAAMTEREVALGVTHLVDAGMVAVDPDMGAYFIPAWEARQFESDNVTERTAKHRSKEQVRNVPTSFVGTPPETDADTETSSSSSDTQGPLEPDDEEIVQQALVVYVDRKLVASNGKVRDPVPWKRTTLTNARNELAPVARDWLTRFDVSPNQLADALVAGSVPASWNNCRRPA